MKAEAGVLRSHFRIQHSGGVRRVDDPTYSYGQRFLKQVLQHLRTGQIEVADVPCPVVRAGHLLIHTSCSLISSGTERTLVEFSRSGLIGKARAQPEKVRQVLDKIKTDGLIPTLELVFNRLDEPPPAGLLQRWARRRGRPWC